MSVLLECQKTKKTGFLPMFLAGSILAAAVPVINMAARAQMYAGQPGTPIQILMRADWQIMAMLNTLLAAAGACLLYHIEYTDNGLQKMESLPMRSTSIFSGKALLFIFMHLFVFAAEAGAVTFCSYYWFELENGFWTELFHTFGYAFLLMLPCTVLSLLIAQAFRNMWVSLGILIVCIFTASMLPADSFILSLFPFALPLRIYADAPQALRHLAAAGTELAVICLAELLFLKIRRSFT